MKPEEKYRNDPLECLSAIWAILVDGDGLTLESQIADIKDILNQFSKRKDKRPHCQNCGEVMVRTHLETDDGMLHFWLCGCKGSK